MDLFLKHRGNYRNLLAYKLAMKISFITEIFVRRFIRKGSRTIDQMQQASRSCKQNIAEGSGASATSMETEIKLTNVARASLCELEEDYTDFLKFNHLSLWDKDHPRTLKMRAYIKSGKFDSEYEDLCMKLPAEEFCNLAITLIKQTQYLLDRMLQSQQKRFLEQGGIREAMTSARINYRRQKNHNNTDNSTSSVNSDPS